MNLINFHKYPKNKPFITESEIQHCGQGLIHPYWVMVNGNGENLYTFTVEQHGTTFKIEFEEKHVIEWRIAASHCEEFRGKTHDTITFKAFGKMLSTGECGWCGWFYTHDWKKFDTLGYDLTIVDISISNKHPEKPHIVVHDDIQYCDQIMCPRQKYVQEFEKLQKSVDTESDESNESDDE